MLQARPYIYVTDVSGGNPFAPSAHGEKQKVDARAALLLLAAATRQLAFCLPEAAPCGCLRPGA